MRRGATTMLAAALAVAACNPRATSDPNDATDANFKTALQTWYDEHPDCVSLGRGERLPIERSVSRFTDNREFDAAVAAGLLSAERLAADRVRYTPTDTGKDAIREGDRFLGGVKLCYARRAIEGIETFTEPADAIGVKATRVTYRYTLKDVAPWARQPAIAAAFPAIPKALAQPSSTDADDLILTDKGWVHHRALR